MPHAQHQGSFILPQTLRQVQLTQSALLHPFNLEQRPMAHVKSLPAQERRAWQPHVAIMIEPPANSEPKGQCQEDSLGGELVGNQQAVPSQQLLAALQRVGHVCGSVQYIGCQQDVKTAVRISLHGCKCRQACSLDPGWSMLQVMAAQLQLTQGYSVAEVPDKSLAP